MEKEKVEYLTHIVKTKKVTKAIINKITGKDMDISVEYVLSDKIVKGGKNNE